MLRLRLLALAAIGSLVAVACGRAHDLGTDTTSSVSMGGAGGATSSSSSSTAASSSGEGGSGGGKIMDPPGPTALTVVNGINDYPAVRLCFLPNEAPWPSSSAGLAFAASDVVKPLSATIPSGTDVTPWVVAGDLAQTSGKTCSQILALAAAGEDAGTASVIARPLGLIPASVFTAERSLLFVPNGCMGGADHDDVNAKLACGQSYSPATPTATALLAAMSRLSTSGRISMQIAGASTALPEVDVGLVPNIMMATPTVIAHSLTPGAVTPFPPFDGFAPADLGPLDGVLVQTFYPGSSSMTSSVPFSEILAHGGPGTAALISGGRVALVAVGGGPGLPNQKWWHALTYTLVLRDPG